MTAASVAGLAAQLHARLQAAGQTVAVAESLTGGLVAAALTGTPGASATFRGGLTVYATDLKAELAGVSPQLLADKGVRWTPRSPSNWPVGYAAGCHPVGASV